MIVVRLIGGLGNQFFQYALARRLTYSNNGQFKLDVSYYRTGNSRIRTYGLRHFNIIENIATEDDLKALGIEDKEGLRSFFGKALGRGKPADGNHRIVERAFGFDPEILKVPDNSYLDGYWQSEKYFADIADVIRAELTPRNKMDDVNEAMASEIKHESSVSLHIRRGDYVTNPENYKFHGTCSLDYYGRCIKGISQEVGSPHFFVFSDDIPWAKKNLKIDHPVTYVNHNDQENDFKDLYLMTKCKHHIIANSTFSWWGAWLAGNTDKIVFAPSKWFNEPKPGEEDLIPETWHRM